MVPPPHTYLAPALLVTSRGTTIAPQPNYRPFTPKGMLGARGCPHLRSKIDILQIWNKMNGFSSAQRKIQWIIPIIHTLFFLDQPKKPEFIHQNVPPRLEALRVVWMLFWRNICNTWRMLDDNSKIKSKNRRKSLRQPETRALTLEARRDRPRICKYSCFQEAESNQW